MPGKQWIAVVFTCATVGAASAECPAPRPFDAAYAQALSDLRHAGSFTEAREASNTLWDFWADAPDDAAQSMLDRGMRAMREAAFDLSVEMLTELIAYCPDYAEGYNQRAFAYFLSGRFERALADLDRTLELSPNHVAAISGRGLTLLQLGREDEGQVALRKALTMHPFMPERRYIRDDSEQKL